MGYAGTRLWRFNFGIRVEVIRVKFYHFYNSSNIKSMLAAILRLAPAENGVACFQTISNKREIAS